jgi:FkbM family methyltransferase
MHYYGSRLRDKLFLFYIRKFPNHPFKLRFVIQIEPLLFRNGLKLTSPSGAHQYLSTREWIGRHVIMHGSFEPKTLLKCAELLNNGGILLDIGANIGMHSLYLSKINNVKVYSVEPSAHNFQLLLTNIALNNASNIYPLNIGLSKTDSFAYLDKSQADNTGSVQVVDSDTGNNSYLIRLTTLFQLVNYLKLGRIDLLKIDVEGFEMNVFEGYFDIGANVMPLNIVIEFSAMINRTGHTLTDCLNYFIKWGYDIYTVEGKTYRLNDELPEHNLWLKRTKSLTI